MKENYFTIGEISKIKGITIKALRFYDRIDLLKPLYIDPDSRYRYYHISQFVYLDIIKAARTMDISPNDLIPFFKSKDSEGLVKFMDGYKEKMYQRISELENIIGSIDEIKKSIINGEAANNEGKVNVKHLPDRYAITVPFDQSKATDEFILDYSELSLIVSKSGLINTYEEGILFAKNDKDEFHPSFLCNFVVGKKDNHDCCLIPRGEYICISYTKDKAVQQQKKIQDYLKKNQLEPLDLVQVSLLTDLLAEETELFELQIMV